MLGGSDTITCGDSRSYAYVDNRGISSLYVRTDGETPSSTGANDGDLVVPPMTGRQFGFADPAAPEIRLAATSNLAYSVELY